MDTAAARQAYEDQLAESIRERGPITARALVPVVHEPPHIARLRHEHGGEHGTYAEDLLPYLGALYRQGRIAVRDTGDGRRGDYTWKITTAALLVEHLDDPTADTNAAKATKIERRRKR